MSQILKALERNTGSKKNFLSKTASENIAAIAREFVKVALENEVKKAQNSEKVAEQVSKLAGEDLVDARIAEAAGRAMARGYAQGKIAGYQEGFSDGVDAGYDGTMNVIKKVAGEENAEQLQNAIEAQDPGEEESGYTEDDMGAAEQAYEEAKQEALEMLIQQVGGIEVLQQNPQLAQEIEELAEQVAAQTVDQATGTGQKMPQQ